jgi:hypothetical protein
MHLTNYSVNKKNPTFQAGGTDINCETEGSKWSLGALRRALQALDIDDKAIFR